MAPHLVIVEYDENGQPYGRRAFNTQVCEQLNSWLGGYQSIAKLMTPGNFNWLLHVMLVYHTQVILKKQDIKKKKAQIQVDDDSDSE